MSVEAFGICLEARKLVRDVATIVLPGCDGEGALPRKQAIVHKIAFVDFVQDARLYLAAGLDLLRVQTLSVPMGAQ